MKFLHIMCISVRKTIVEHCLVTDMDKYKAGIDKMEAGMAETYEVLRRDYLTFVLNTVHNISLKYLVHVKSKEDTITYVSRIPAKYWHRLYECYDFLVSSQDIKLPREKSRIRRMYIALIPTWIDFNAVQRYRRFSWYHRLYYDKIWSNQD